MAAAVAAAPARHSGSGSSAVVQQEEQEQQHDQKHQRRAPSRGSDCVSRSGVSDRSDAAALLLSTTMSDERVSRVPLSIQEY